MATQNNKRLVSSPSSEEKRPPRKTKRRTRTGKIPLNDSSEGTEEYICPVCLDSITDEHDSIYCEGSCDRWLHRCCAGLSKVLFNVWIDSDDPFYCPHCRLSRHAELLSSMQSTIQSLLQDVASLKSRQSESMELGAPTGSLDSGTDTSNQGTTQQTQPKIITPRNNPGIFSDRKFYLVIQGIPECSSDMKRLERL